MTVKIAVFASGSGSNFQALIDAVKDGRLDAEITLLVCDRPGAYACARARQEGVSSFIFSPKDYQTKADFEEEITAMLVHQDINWVILAGYMRLIGHTLLSKYRGRIINIHPSLLPAFAGKDAIGQAIAADVKVTGVTIHEVDEGVDTGRIIAQEAVRIEPDDKQASLQQKIQAAEHRLYPETIQELMGVYTGN